jgi:hypothetical protein
MKNKVSLLFACIALIVAIGINFQGKMEQNKVLRLGIGTLGKIAFADPEYPHYGNYGRDYQNCSITATATANGTITWHGITIPVTANVEFSLSCTNCAWDCNANGANNTCDPENC